MGKVHVKWPYSEMDRLVQRFFDRVGIDHRYVRGYQIDRAHDSFTTIKVDMWFDDEPAIVGEHGPELTDLEPGGVIHPNR